MALRSPILAQEIARELERCAGRSVNVPGDEEMTAAAGYHRYYSEAVVAQEAPELPVPHGAFDQARVLVESYAFSDPRIVRAHFDPAALLLGRTMVLELCAYGLCYLCGVRVTHVRKRSEGDHAVFAFRYDTLEGHIERGAEWFVLRKDRRSGRVEFRIEANWKPGVFPNWWSRLGFRWVGPRFQRAWHRLAYLRLRALLETRGLPPLPR